MGELADDVVDGACCGWCMLYFEKEHGYPVLCSACWENASEELRKDWQKATENVL